MVPKCFLTHRAKKAYDILYIYKKPSVRFPECDEEYKIGFVTDGIQV